MYLQSYVIPICLYEHSDDGTATSTKLLGSAFFINKNGLAVTAKHVLKNAIASGEKWGMTVHSENGKSEKKLIATADKYAFAPEPFDIAVIQTPYRGDTIFKLSDQIFEVWQDVATFGYPEDTVRDDPYGRMRISNRFFKGYIQRILHPQDHADRGIPLSYEVSFPIGTGQSGSPLFVYRGSHDELVGVCIGTHRSEIVLDRITDVS